MSQLYAVLEVGSPQDKSLALRCIAIVLGVSEQRRDEWMKTVMADPMDNLAVDEADRMYNLHQSLRSQSEDEDDNVNYPSNRYLVNLQGVLVPRTKWIPDSKTSFDEVILTGPTIKALQEIAMGLREQQAILLSGSGGSGKTFYVEECAKLFDMHKDLVRIHLGEQTDAKLLVGTYSTGTTPGSFEWRPGVLTVAVQQGRWVLIEDIDHAPNEIVSVILPLIEKRELLIPSRGETIYAKSGFQIFATRKNTQKALIGHRHWREVEVQSPNLSDLERILRQKFDLGDLAADLVRVFDTLKSSTKSSVRNRGVTARDVVKWARRTKHLVLSESNLEITESQYEEIFMHGVDCLAGALEMNTNELIVIGESLGLSRQRVELFVSKHIPNFDASDESVVVVGRAGSLPRVPSLRRKKTQFAITNHAKRLIEQLGVAVSMREPLLLVGETGTGKTTVVQYLANILNKRLVVINVSQQTESSDLIGGFRPVDARMLVGPLREEFDSLFTSTFGTKGNDKFLADVASHITKCRWSNLAKRWKQAVELAQQTLEATVKKRKRAVNYDRLAKRWEVFFDKVVDFEVQVKNQSRAVFAFVEGLLVQAVRNGDWVLLDEVNLASADTLESLGELLAENPSITLTEKGDASTVYAHPEFRLFGCMNPSTDVGKRELPEGIRSRFTELYVRSPDQDVADLLQIVDKYIGAVAATDSWASNDIVSLYLEIKRMIDNNEIVDGAGQRLHLSIRTLSRSLVYASFIAPVYGLRRALYEGFSMTCLTLLNLESENLLRPVVAKHTIGRLKNAKSVLNTIPPAPSDGSQYVQFEQYWLKVGSFLNSSDADSSYVITPFVQKNLLNVARATASGKFPILLQGPTSSGKTSMVQYLAKRTGHKCVRINNHEHTDLQEYLGSYVSDDKGTLRFQEGILVEAVRNGYWIVLDELNLAPTDVLEALNRLLDDNRELLIPETQEVVKPHADFMLFATQNPPGLYGGRKILSRAFRNRFLELHFDDIPVGELEVILRERSKIAPSYAKKIVEVYKELSFVRQGSRVFDKHGFATLRDLFRWANRGAVGYDELAWHGYTLLAERVRVAEEKLIVKEIIERVMKVKLDIDGTYDSLLPREVVDRESTIVWTKGMRRLLVLVNESLKRCEPVLLVGETGCGKTSVCQELALALNQELRILNGHQNTETGDILGAQRPTRKREAVRAELMQCLGGNAEELDMTDLKHRIEEIADESQKTHAMRLCEQLNILFEWHDGPLVQAMKNGDMFLFDEMSLADDSVLERLNSVLEPERFLLLAEKGMGSEEPVEANPKFQFLATMNPGGDYGKKELSPALRNRFTEIWVPSMEDQSDLVMILESKLHIAEKRQAAELMVQFAEWFACAYGQGNAGGGVVSIRDLLKWVEFVNSQTSNGNLDLTLALYNGACLAFIDGLGVNGLGSQSFRQEALTKLGNLLQWSEILDNYNKAPELVMAEDSIQINGFRLERNLNAVRDSEFALQAPTTKTNALRVIRALEVRRPILLEGSPGVGKTSLVVALADMAGANLTRINLSEQTDLIDLFGSDVPGEKAGQFVWRDAPFLRAMQRGEWVLLDEMNLASQSVLEGLNACLDHRGEAYIPELDKSFSCGKGFTVFAAQNPQSQGGGRKGLPKSFVNRFSMVYMDTLAFEDLSVIAQSFKQKPMNMQKMMHTQEVVVHKCPLDGDDVVDKMISYIYDLERRTSDREFGVVGSPWEFNLRDVSRWVGLGGLPGDNLGLITQRFRTQEDIDRATALFETHFGERRLLNQFYQIRPEFWQMGRYAATKLLGSSAAAMNSGLEKVYHLQCNTHVLETIMIAIQQAWPTILVGPSNAGKTFVLRQLAYQYGKHLHEFCMNGDIDSTDLLGGFDQANADHDLAKVWDKVENFTTGVVLFAIGQSQELLSIMSSSMELCRERHPSSLRQCSKLLTEAIPLLTSGSLIECCRDLVDVIETQLEIASESQTQGGHFKWFDGVLLQAVELGHWLVLDNANLCSPSVLDRLNSLLEKDGKLVVNESSLSNGEPRIVVPHKDFRLFLTVNPAYGELSRAMRNRGVEIYMSDLESRATEFDRRLLSKNVRLSFIDDTKESKARWMVHALDSGISDCSRVEEITPFAFVATDATRNMMRQTTRFPLLKEALAMLGDLQTGAVYHPLNSLLTTNSSETHYQILCALRSEDLRHVLELAHEAAATKPLNQLSYLELSVAPQFRQVKAQPAPIWSVVELILHFVKSNVPLSEALQLLELATDIVTITSRPSFNEAMLPALKELLDNFSGFVQFTQQNALAAHFNSLKLTTGLSMNLIWNQYRRRECPTTENEWMLYEKIVNLCDRFDQITFATGDANTRALFVKSIQNFDAAFDIQYLESQLEALESLKVDLQPTALQECFKLLLTYVELKMCSQRSFVNIDNLALYARETSLHLQQYSRDQVELQRPYEPVLDEISQSSDALCEDLAYRILRKRLHTGNAQQHQQTIVEFATLHRELIARRHVVLESKLVMLDEMLLKRVADMKALHENASPEMRENFTAWCGNIGSWIDMAQAFVGLYVPNIPHDPALIQKADMERFERQTLSFSILKTTWERVKSTFLTSKETLVDDELLKLNPANAELAEKTKLADRVYRPETSDVSIFREWQEMVTTNMNRTINWFVQASEPEIAMWYNNCDMFVLRMSQRRETDICGIFIGAVRMLQVGVRVLRMKAPQSVWWVVDPVAICWPAVKAEDDYSMLESMRAASYAKNVTLANTIGDYFYQKWSSSEIQKQQEAKMQASLYRTQDEALEMRDMFGDEDEDDDNEHKSESSGTEDTFSEFVTLYLSLFDQRPAFQDVIEKNLRGMAEGKNSLEGASGDSRPYTGLLFLTENWNKNPKERTNFYRGPNVEATQSCIIFFTELRKRIGKFLQEFSDHSTLLNIYAAIDELLLFPAAAPVLKYLGKVEQIFTFLNEWNKYAHSGISVTEEIAQCAQIIISWRRLELKCWSELFDEEDSKLHNQTIKLWFHLYEILLVSSRKMTVGQTVKTEELVQVVQSLTLFLSQSKVGDFNTRLAMLECFACEDNTDISLDLRNVLHNVIRFYSQFKANNTARLAGERQQLTKAMNEQILLASWKDTNPAALKESARRSHQKLYKVVRKYRDAINGGVTFSVSTEEQARKETHLILPKSFVAQSFDTSCISNLLKNRPRRLQDSSITARLMLEHRPDLTGYIGEGTKALFEISESAQQEATRLRKATPSVFNGETKKEISQLKMEKSKLLAEMIKLVRDECGFKTNTKADTTQQLALVSNVLASSEAPVLPNGATTIDKHFVEILDMLPRVRSSIASGNSDVGPNLSRAFAQGENAVAFLIRLRNTFAQALKKFTELDSLLDLTKSLLSLGEISRLNTKTGFGTVDTIVSRSREILVLCSNIARYSNESELIDAYSQKIDTLSDVHTKWNAGIKTAARGGYASCELGELVKQLESVFTSGDISRDTYSGAYFWLWSDAVVAKIRDQGDLSPVANSQDLELAMCQLCDSVLVCMQRLPKIDKENEDTSEPLVSRLGVLYRYVSCLHIDEIGNRLRRVLNLANNDFGPIVGSLAPILTSYNQVCGELLQLLSTCYSHASESILRLMKIVDVLAKNGYCGPQEGEEDQQDQSEGQEREGTGMGEGAGSKTEQLDQNDIDEEDMLDEAQRENEDQNDDKDQQDEDDNAIDIDGDMAGQIEELSDQEKDDNEDQQGEDEENQDEELDDEVGDIDELDPNQVDEKMWDEEAKEQNEKQADSAKGQKEEAEQGQEQDGEPQEPDSESNDNQNENEMEEDDKKEDDENASDEESVGEQEDAVHDDQNQDEMADVPDAEALELPEDMNFDGDENEKEGDGDEDEFDDAMDDFEEEAMDIDESQPEKDGGAEPEEQDKDNEEAAEMGEDEDEDKSEEKENDADNEADVDENNDADMENENGEDQQQDLEAPEHDGEDAQSTAKAETAGQDENEDDTAEAVGVEQQAEDMASNAEQQQSKTSSNENNGADAMDTSTADQAAADIDETQDEAREKAREQMRQLGDVLKEFYRRREDIRDASEKNPDKEESKDEDEAAARKPDEFEHVEGEEDASHQALGSTDVFQGINDDMEIDEEEQEDKEEVGAETEAFKEGEEDEGAGQGEAEGEAEDAGEAGDETPEQRQASVPGEKRDVQEQSDHESEPETETGESSSLQLSTPQDGEINSRELWHKYDVRTQSLAPALCEQLRLILEPTLTSKLSGDFKTGKRLNMKRVIPYIASQFKKDKIWLRRTKPSKRQFQIMISVDDSRSMRESQAVDLAFETIALVAKALTLLESGQLAITRFGEDTQVLHPFAQPFSNSSGAQVVQHFTFDQQKTDVQKLLEKAITLFEEARFDSSSTSNADLWQLQIIISDGVCEDHLALRRLVRKARESRIMLVFVVLDGLNSSSVLDMNQVVFENDQLKLSKYFDTFPFDYYVIVRDVNELPSVLSSVLRQYFEEVAEV